MRTFLIFLFVAVVSLVVYNPEMEDFKTYIDSEVQKERLEQHTSITSQMFTKDSFAPRKSAPETFTERNNFLIFSTYKITVKNPSSLIEPLVETRYLGIVSMFFELGHSGSSDMQPDQP